MLCMRICTGCKSKLPNNKFYRDSRLGRHRSKCKACTDIMVKKYKKSDYLRSLFYSVKTRCNSHSHYVRRGIKFKFNSLEEFKISLGPRPSERHSIDRIDNAKHYEPGNVRWATSHEQAMNRSNNISTETINNAVLCYLKNKTISIRKICEMFNLSRSQFNKRVPNLYEEKIDIYGSSIPYYRKSLRLRREQGKIDLRTNGSSRLRKDS